MIVRLRGAAAPAKRDRSLIMSFTSSTEKFFSSTLFLPYFFFG
jgi:hypothetical protein